MLLNISNHRPENWQKRQLEAAREYGEIVDFPFPAVSPEATAEEICALADEVFAEAAALRPDCVLCCGEFTLTWQLVKRFLAHGIKTVAPCTQRICRETVLPSGEIRREAVFDFVQFREYQ